MRLRLANLRLGQQLYTLPYIKDLFHVVSSHLPPTFRDQVTVRGLESIWSPTYEDQAQKYGDIDDIITLIRLNGGSAVLFKTISYLDDRLVIFKYLIRTRFSNLKHITVGDKILSHT